MKFIVYPLAAVGAVAVLMMLGGNAKAPGCPPIGAGAITLPAEHASDLETMQNAADVLNNRMGVCVIEGSWGAGQGKYYFAVQEPGKKPEFRRYNGSELRSLASLGQR